MVELQYSNNSTARHRSNSDILLKMLLTIEILDA